MIEGDKKDIYLVPIPMETLVTPTGQKFEQIEEIPVEITEVTFPLHIYYPHFSSPPVNITKGGYDIETSIQRVRWEMVYRLQIDSAALENTDPPLNARSAVEVIQQFIRLL